MAQQRGMSFDKFRQRFQTNESCREYLYQLRWPRGFVCPRCGAAGGYPIKGRSEYSCKHCHKQTSVTAGTVMHRTHLPPTVWFWAMYLVARDKRGISATQLSRELEIAYSSAWYLLQRLRSAMGKRDQKYILSGTIELDDAYFGTPSVGGKRGRGTDKTSALVAVSKNKDGHPQFLKLKVSGLAADEVKRFAECSFEPSSKVNTDALQSFQTALKDFEHHFEVFEKGNGDLRWVHTLISNVKSFVLGTYHGLGKKHLQAYFDEFAFRFNRRFWQDQLFSRLAYAVMDSHILGYVDLTR